jgi:hypothetical protein
MPALAVGGPDLHGGDDFAPALDLGRRHRPRAAPIGAVRVFRAAVAAQQAIQRGAAHRVELRRGFHQHTALGVAGRQCRETAAEGRERLNRHGAPYRHLHPGGFEGAALWRPDAHLRPRTGAVRAVEQRLAAALGVPSPLT